MADEDNRVPFTGRDQKIFNAGYSIAELVIKEYSKAVHDKADFIFGGEILTGIVDGALKALGDARAVFPDLDNKSEE